MGRLASARPRDPSTRRSLLRPLRGSVRPVKASPLPERPLEPQRPLKRLLEPLDKTQGKKDRSLARATIGQET